MAEKEKKQHNPIRFFTFVRLYVNTVAVTVSVNNAIHKYISWTPEKSTTKEQITVENHKLRFVLFVLVYYTLIYDTSREKKWKKKERKKRRWADTQMHVRTKTKPTPI